MAAMMTVSGCIYRLSRSVPARRPSRVNLNRSVSTRYSTLASRIAPIEFPVPVIRPRSARLFLPHSRFTHAFHFSQLASQFAK